MVHLSSLAMQRLSIEPRDCIFVEGYRFLSFAKNMGKSVGKNLCSKYSSY